MRNFSQTAADSRGEPDAYGQHRFIPALNYMVNKLSKITSHLVYVASSNNAQIWINSDVWLSFSHKLFRTCMAHYICISEMSRATEITISRAAVKWPMHVIRNKPSFVLYLISDYLLGGCIAVRWGRWGLSLDLTVCYDLPKVYFNSADCLNT